MIDAPTQGLVSRRDPKPGEVWRRGRFYTFVGHPQETRHVLERNLGGDVFFVSGRYSRHAHLQQCTREQWHEWAGDGYGAKKIA